MKRREEHKTYHSLELFIKQKLMGVGKMLINKRSLILLVIMIAILGLTACASIESKFIGSWKVISNGDDSSYIEVTEKRIIVRESENDRTTAEYILTKTQDDKFIIELINPEKGSNEFMFEGYFENKNKIKIIAIPNGEAKDNELIRVDNIAKEIEKDKKKAQEKEKKEIAEEKKRTELAEEEDKKKREEDVAKEKAFLESNQQVHEKSLKKNYLTRSDNLENKIIKEAKKVSAHDMRTGFYGQYFQDWDELLNEVWDVLKEELPSGEFKTLESDQIKWNKEKERNFAEMPDETASARAEGMDYLAFETAKRTRYLIENFMN
ncbi:lysozyme inhibitor LprI family protein [Bacillus safensis]|uniref:lysozyme inhibitor LprI family protein n=1 Tax=Bacillus safensis TaxID=561879 RepID=UPI002040B50F|nr:lysozyme inhibitor LprI family protein [Bacillus safensis]MCM2989262.1 lysozyme inhibitor LprI family protein [Bacillus safensis]